MSLPPKLRPAAAHAPRARSAAGWLAARRPAARVVTLAPARAALAAAALFAVGPLYAQSLGPLASQTVHDLADLSLDQLSQIEVTSVSKRPEPLSQSPAAVYVITDDAIRRSGATTLAEALRLAPNLEVARLNAQNFLVSARGFNSVNASNKLLVLIDGRSVFTPLFNSVFWDEQQVMLDDVERIEVISGPGGTLWGTNAVNGVINVITKGAADTQGGLVDVRGGNFMRHGAARWGGRLGDAGAYRVYAMGFGVRHTDLVDGASAEADWHGAQAGFRSDFTALGGSMTVQGDGYRNVIDQPSGGRRTGGNLLGRWSHALADGGSLQVQAYYDQDKRVDMAPDGGSAREEVDTVDLTVEHRFSLGERHQIVWGAGTRSSRDLFTNTVNPFVLVPEAQTVTLADLFAQDTITLSRDVKLTVGSKFENSSFSGWAVMPNLRVGWQATPRNFLWAAVSRSVRPPSRLERDLYAPGIVETSPEFRSEKVVAWEAGWRSQLAERASASVSLFYNRYTDLRTTSLSPGGTLPAHFGNGLEGHSAGIEAWGSVSPLPWWRLTPGVTLLHKDFHLKPGETDISGTQTVLGHDPNHQIFLNSYMDLPHDVELFIGLRQIGALPDVGVSSYFETDLRIGWRVNPNLELSLAGYNLAHLRHAEASQPPIQEIPRSFYLGARWTF